MTRYIFRHGVVLLSLGKRACFGFLAAILEAAQRSRCFRWNLYINVGPGTSELVYNGGGL